MARVGEAAKQLTSCTEDCSLNMTDELTLIRGIPERDSTLELLNEAYGDWGDESLLQWKYDQYPGYEDRHAFAITDGEAVVAFRRLFNKEIVAASRPNYRFFVLGDTCVALDHRGQGLYSELHEETTEFCKRQGSDFSCTFNRVQNITYKANLDRGWQYRALPIKLRILSPKAVLSQFAEFAIGDESAVNTVLDRVGHRVGISVNGERLQANELVGKDSRDGFTLYAPVPDRILPSLVEVASSTESMRTLRRRLVREQRPAASATVDTTVWTPPFDDRLLERLRELYRSVLASYELNFRREYEDIEHMLSHPYLEAVVVGEQDGDLVSAAPICLDTDGGVLEARVLDVVARDEDAFSALMERVEAVGIDRGVGLIVAITDETPGTEWVDVDRQVMMWDEYDADTSPLPEEPLHIGLYDVV